jgi:hypothetical protein
MFNNRFNSTHKDPLVEAVKQAQQDGETRRRAEAHVNEQFGVYSRNAVVREDLAAYDAAIEEAYKCMKEGKPLDPVGREDKDIDNDGDHDKSDKYLLNRRKAIGNAMGKRMEEGAMDSDVVGGGAVTKDNKPVVSSTAPKVNTSGPSASDKAGLAAKIGAMKEESLDEKYRDAPKKDDVNRRKRDAVAMKIGHNNPEDRNDKYYRPVSMLKHGRKLMRAGVTKEETQIDEISKELAGRYIKKADYKRSDSSFQSGKVYGKELATKKRTKQDVEDARKHNRDSFKREKGINTAVNKLTGRAKVQANEESINEAAFSAKAARAGKDIGKPGKMFAQIAAKASEKYGSEERGKKVAGAILKKIRAKHVKEENLEELSAFGSAFAAARKAGQSTFNMGGKSYTTQIKGQSSTPTPPSRPAGVGADKPVGDTGYKSGRTVSLKPIVEPGTAQAAVNKPEPSRSTPIPGQKSPAPVNQADTINKSGGVAPIAPPKVAPTPPSRPADLGGSSAPAKPMQNPDQNITKVMKEEVQIGDYKYKII